MGDLLIPRGFEPTGNPQEWVAWCNDCGQKKLYWNPWKQMAKCWSCHPSGKTRSVLRSLGDHGAQKHSLFSIRRPARPVDPGPDYPAWENALARRYLAHRGVSEEESLALELRSDSLRSQLCTIRFGMAERIVRWKQHGFHHSLLDGERRTSWKGDGDFEYRNHHRKGTRLDPWILGPGDCNVPQGQSRQLGLLRGKNRALVCVEGQFDGIRVRQSGYSAAVFFGQPSVERIVQLLENSRMGVQGSLRLVLLLDAEAASNAEKLHRQLSRKGIRCDNRTPRLVDHARSRRRTKLDPDNCSIEELKEILG